MIVSWTTEQVGCDWELIRQSKKKIAQDKVDENRATLRQWEKVATGGGWRDAC